MRRGKKFSHLLHEYDALDDAIVHVHVHFVVVARHYFPGTANNGSNPAVSLGRPSVKKPLQKTGGGNLLGELTTESRRSVSVRCEPRPRKAAGGGGSEISSEAVLVLEVPELLLGE